MILFVFDAVAAVDFGEKILNLSLHFHNSDIERLHAGRANLTKTTCQCGNIRTVSA